MSFPVTRLRRLRRSELLRSFVRETRLSPKDFIYPLFVCAGAGIKREISSMPGNYHFSVDRLGEECREVAGLGVPAVLLFGIPESKDERGSGAYGEDCIVAQAIRAIQESDFRPTPSELACSGCPVLDVVCAGPRLPGGGYDRRLAPAASLGA